MQSFPKNVLAVADTEGGNLICIDVKKGGVFLWDHERETADDEEPSFDIMDFLASSFSEFLHELQSFNPQDVVLDPNDVILVEFKPGFLGAC